MAQVVLRDYAERDIPEILIAHQDDPRMHLLTGEDRPPSGAELGRAAEREPLERAAGERATLTILEPGSDACRGQIRVYPVDWDQSRAEVGIWLAPQIRGHGLGRSALTLAGAVAPRTLWARPRRALHRAGQCADDPRRAGRRVRPRGRPARVSAPEG